MHGLTLLVVRDSACKNHRPEIPQRFPRQSRLSSGDQRKCADSTKAEDVAANASNQRVQNTTLWGNRTRLTKSLRVSKSNHTTQVQAKGAVFHTL